ncbi:hypothetical protein BJV74DRAFT_854862 [Russula compacta]|nr:hypothetical protein BJV74DRAFT_854862 [Russula compacta]
MSYPEKSKTEEKVYPSAPPQKSYPESPMPPYSPPPAPQKEVSPKPEEKAYSYPPPPSKPEEKPYYPLLQPEEKPKPGDNSKPERKPEEDDYAVPPSKEDKPNPYEKPYPPPSPQKPYYPQAKGESYKQKPQTSKMDAAQNQCGADKWQCCDQANIGKASDPEMIELLNSLGITPPDDDDTLIATDCSPLTGESEDGSCDAYSQQLCCEESYPDKSVSVGCSLPDFSTLFYAMQ